MSFEETYPRYPFADLVRFGMLAAKFFRRMVDRRQAARVNSEAHGSEVAPASHTQTASIA